jgi:hypothetical protein
MIESRDARVPFNLPDPLNASESAVALRLGVRERPVDRAPAAEASAVTSLMYWKLLRLALRL